MIKKKSIMINKFHDAIIDLIEINYDKKNIAPWGESFYIYELLEIKNSKLFKGKIEDIKSKETYTHFQFVLNSGDLIDIIAQKFKLTTKLSS
jgi:hypothetical protein